MHRSSALMKKSLAQIEPGELIRYSFNNSASLLLLLEKREGNGLFGVITSPLFEHDMSSYEMALDSHCLSYGHDWFLEEIHGSETVVGGYYLAQNSNLVLDTQGPVFIFRPERGEYGFRPTFFSTSENTTLQNLDRQQSAPVKEWRVWETEKHFSDGGIPLFEMKP